MILEVCCLWNQMNAFFVFYRKERMYKFIFVTGGVVSGLGKGITAASLGRLLKARGLKISAQKLDPYLNIDPGTMSPFQHGEVFVTGQRTELKQTWTWGITKGL